MSIGLILILVSDSGGRKNLASALPGRARPADRTNLCVASIPGTLDGPRWWHALRVWRLGNILSIYTMQVRKSTQTNRRLISTIPISNPMLSKRRPDIGIPSSRRRAVSRTINLIQVQGTQNLKLKREHTNGTLPLYHNASPRSLRPSPENYANER